MYDVVENCDFVSRHSDACRLLLLFEPIWQIIFWSRTQLHRWL